ncbi:DUF6262 family protein [Sinomonas humi]|uniref:Transposase n=1 Tax=Sinomonas humi TaxID=1338436 RepID=A0A0B2AKW2_9MICC|nr:DUF6262 family protein [Sinomonas humi]KHL04300.1 hypothetical protein LK10_05990 [Sinomonas humi]
MASARRQDSDTKRAATASAINRFLLDGTLVTVSAIAHAVGVSRNFIYSHESLLHQLEAARQTQADARIPRQRQPIHGAPGRAALTAELAMANQSIRRLRQELAELQARHQRCLGDKVSAADARPQHDSAVAQKRMIEQLTEQNRFLTRQAEALSHQIKDLTDDLTAERRATSD